MLAFTRQNDILFNKESNQKRGSKTSNYIITTVSGKKVPFSSDDAMAIATTVYERDFDKNNDTIEDILCAIRYRAGRYYVKN